jgi:hypothetical protein
MASIGNFVVRLCPLLLYVLLMSRPPCASPPPGLEVFVGRALDAIFSTQCLFYILFLICLAILIRIGEVFCSNVYFLPFNVRLNMLNGKHKNDFNCLIPFIVRSIYFLLYYAVYITNNGAFVHMLNYLNLDALCLRTWKCTILLNNLIFNSGILVAKKVILCTFNKILCPKYHSHEVNATWIFCLLLLLSHDVHPNPGPNSNSEFSSGFLSFCNWNLNTLSKDNFCRVSLLEAHNSIFNYDIISLCETSLNDEIEIPVNLLPGYFYHPLNHPDGKKVAE